MSALSDKTPVIVGAGLAGATTAFALRDGDMPLDELLVRSAEDDDAVALFLRAGRLASVLSVENGKGLGRAEQLIGPAVDAATLADPSIDLRQLLPLAAAAR